MTEDHEDFIGRDPGVWASRCLWVGLPLLLGGAMTGWVWLGYLGVGWMVPTYLLWLTARRRWQREQQRRAQPATVGDIEALGEALRLLFERQEAILEAIGRVAEKVDSRGSLDSGGTWAEE